jgi:hypothetical protein
LHDLIENIICPIFKRSSWSSFKKITKKMCRVSARRLSIYNFVWGRLKATKKVYFIPQKWKKNKDAYMGSIRQSLQAQPINIKKLSKHQVNQSKEKKFSNKSLFSTSKVKRRQKFIWGLPDGVYRLNLKSYKNYQNTKSTNQDENFSKKSMLSTLKKKRG